VRIDVNGEVCMGHAMCMSVAPEVYELDEFGYNRMGAFAVGDDRRDAATRGLLACPEQAITAEPEA
jgi:ferredoxin